MKRAKVHIYKAKDGYRWHMRAPNGRIIDESGEAYTREHDAVRAAAMVRDTWTRAEWVFDSPLAVKPTAKPTSRPGEVVILGHNERAGAL